MKKVLAFGVVAAAVVLAGQKSAEGGCLRSAAAVRGRAVASAYFAPIDPFAYQQALAAQLRAQQLILQSQLAPHTLTARRGAIQAAQGVNAQASGGRAAVVRTGGLRGF